MNLLINALQHDLADLAKAKGLEKARVQYKVNARGEVGSSRVDLQACKLEYSIVSPK